MAAKEAQARIKINKLLEEAGWRLVDSLAGKANVLLENGVKLTHKTLGEFGDDFDKTKQGFVDYLLLDAKEFPCAVLEAKAEDKDPLAGKEQARRYAVSQNCRFVILSNGNLHYLWDLERGNPNVITRFPTQSELAGYTAPGGDHALLVREAVGADYIVLTQTPDYAKNPEYLNERTRSEFSLKNNLRFLRDYQVDAVHAIQNAVRDGRDRFLFEMATGTGKTLIAAAVIKLFLRTDNARRVLFLVDRIELENQAWKAFNTVLKNDFLAIIYKENRDDWRKAEIVVSTIQTFLAHNRYMRTFQADDFDFVISDEAHRSIGGNSRAVFEYFGGYKLGLTATPKDYLKHIDTADINDPRELERRTLLDSYRTFGCESGEPTFRYSLMDGVRDGFLVNPVVLDARTEITTQLLSEQGYAVAVAKSNDNGDDTDTDTNTIDTIEEIFVHRDFEKKFFSENTNAAFCKAFLEHALRDPISGETGKALVFCVSQHHASKITQLLNIYADKMFPGKYQSDFALQVTSSIPNAQEFTRQFANNNLSGNGNFNESYTTCKTRVCVTVGMMSTGYDCPDILNLCLMRPIFSPSEFIQIKGRGTRRHNFSVDLRDQKLRKQVGEQQKTRYKLFDFFANCEYFEEKFKYDEKLELPRNKDGALADTTWDPQKPVDSYTSNRDDALASLAETEIGCEGMKIDRMYFERFTDALQTAVAEKPSLKAQADAGELNEVIAFVEKHIFNKPQDYFTLEKLRRAARVDRRITFIEILQKALGQIPYFKSRDELLNEEFDKFDSRYLPDEAYFDACKTMFTAYINDLDFRATVDSGNYALLFVSAYGEAFRKLTPDLRKKIPEYIKDSVPLNMFAP